MRRLNQHFFFMRFIYVYFGPGTDNWSFCTWCRAHAKWLEEEDPFRKRTEQGFSVVHFFPPSDAKISSSSDKTASTRLLFFSSQLLFFFLLSLVLGEAGSRFLLSSRTEKTLIGCSGQLIVPQIGAWQDGCFSFQTHFHWMGHWWPDLSFACIHSQRPYRC